MFKIKEATGRVLEAYGTFVDEDGIVQFILCDSDGKFFATNYGTNYFCELYEEDSETVPGSNVMRLDFDVACCNSDGKAVKGIERSVSVLFNKTVISEETVNELISSGEYEYDSRIVVTTPTQANNLKDK